MADSFAAAEDYGNALNLYRQASIAMPEDTRPLVGMAGMYWKAGAVEQATRLYQQILTLDPTNSDAAGGVAEGMLYQGRGDDTAAFINEFLVQGGQGTSTLFNALGVAYDLMGNQDGAQLAYAEGLDLEPGDSAISNNLALSFAVRGNYETAVGLLQKSLDRPEDQKISRQNLALVYALSGQVDAAIEIASTVLSDQEIAINRVFYSRLAGLSATQKAEAVFLGRLPTLQAGTAVAEPDLKDEIPAPRVTESNADEAEEEVETADPVGTTDPVESADPVEAVGERPDMPLQALIDTPDETPMNMPAETFTTPLDRDDNGDMSPDPGLDSNLSVSYPPYWIQLGSYRSVERASLGWQTLSDSQAELLSGYDAYAQSFESADRGAFERLLLEGFETRSAANLLCDELKLGGIDCLVLQTSSGIRPLGEAALEGKQPESP